MFERHQAAKALLLPLLFVIAGCQTLDTRVAPGSHGEIVNKSVSQKPILIRKLVDSKLDNGPVKTASDAPDDLWQRIRNQYSLGKYEHPRIDHELKRYHGKQAFFTRVATRADPYLYLIVDELDRAGLPGEIALLPIVESAFKPFAYSHGRASGIWQFISATGIRYGMKQSWWYDGRRDILQSTRGAIRYLSALNKHFNGDWLLALAAYNTGEYNVDRAIKRNMKAGKPTTFWDLDLPRETEMYVPRLLAFSKIIADPARFEITLKPIANEPHLAVVDTGGQIDLAIAAEMAGLSLDELYRLNPGFNRWATDPDGPHRLLIPRTSKAAFETALAAIPSEKRVRWTRHRIRKGEALSLIAERYRTTPKAIRAINNMHSDRIRAGRYLLVPVASKGAAQYTLSTLQRRASLQRAATTKRHGNQRLVYTVRNGDSLWSIASRFKVSHTKLARWNGLNIADPLRVGRKLTVWRQAIAKTPSTQANRAGRYVQKVSYKVRNGDSLALIAQRFSVSLKQLKRWNPEHSGPYIHPGQTLTLHVDVSKTTPI